MSPIKIISSIIVFVLLLVVMSGLYVVKENENAIVLKLGKIELNDKGKPAVKKPGLHFKFPFITQARIFDIRIQAINEDASTFKLVSQERVMVDYYILWRITNVPLYYIRTSGMTSKAITLIGQKVNHAIRDEFGNRTMHNVISEGRANIMSNLRLRTNKSVQELGVSIIDVRIRKIDLPIEVSHAVYARMRTDRKLEATKLRADGKKSAREIKAEADKTVVITLAEAEKRALTLQGEGDAKSARIYADAYSKAPDFYAFLRSLDAYKKSFNSKQDILVLKPNNEFFKYFKKAGINSNS